MDYVLSIVKKGLLWIFVAFCLFMALCCLFISIPGSILFLATAIISAPHKIVSDTWNKVLGIKEIEAPKDDTPAKWYQAKKKKEQKEYKKAVENQKNRKIIKPIAIVSLFLFSFIFAMAGTETTNSAETEIAEIEVSEEIETAEEIDKSEEVAETPVVEVEIDEAEEIGEEKEDEEFELQEIERPEVVAELSTSFDLASVPAYSGSPYVVINDNVPYFADNEISTSSYEYYSDLDSLGRCGVCVASIGKDIMPTGESGEIGSIKPSGWKTEKYPGVVEGNYLYNRCHLLGWQLTGENDNTKNLITGTRYMNVEGMLPFENMVADYIKETGNHVMYRVTPIFEGDNLVASGVLMEAKSVEDSGDGVLFNAYCYNVQPEVSINYSNGESVLDNPVVEEEPVSTPNAKETQEVSDTASKKQEQTPVTSGGAYAVNAKNGKIHMIGACPATGNGDNAMTNPVYFNTYEEAEAYSISIAPGQDKRKCGNCW
ncbi:MAG: DNA/RNA non-specific endonuclease [Lachnospiraceae bacterium]